MENFDNKENLIKIVCPNESIKSFEYHPKFNKRKVMITCIILEFLEFINSNPINNKGNLFIRWQTQYIVILINIKRFNYLI